MRLRSRAARGVELVSVTELERRLQMAVAHGAPAVVFGAVWREGGTLLRAAGYSDLRSGRLVSTDTPFSWFSITKLFTATAVMQFVESGTVALDEPVSRYLPEQRLTMNGREATVRHLLSHTAGLPNPIPVSWIHLVAEPGPSLDSLTTRVIRPNQKLKFEPGAKSSYSNLGYLLLGQLVERVSGEPYEEYIQGHVLTPLGCEATGFHVPGGAATGNQRRWSLMGLASRWMLDARFFGDSMDGYTALQPFTVDGAPYGGLIGPASDLLHFAHMMLRGGRGANDVILDESSVRAVLTPVLDQEGRECAVGLGWHLGGERETRYAYHLGGGGGFRSEIRIYPSLGYAVAVLANETSFPTETLTRLVVGREPLSTG